MVSKFRKVKIRADALEDVMDAIEYLIRSADNLVAEYREAIDADPEGATEYAKRDLETAEIRRDTFAEVVKALEKLL